MTRRSAALTIAVLPLGGAQKRSDKQKGPEVGLLSASARVENGRINMDGRVKNVGERPIRKLTINFDILDSDDKVLTRQQGPIDEEELDPGNEASFHAQMAFHARAVAFRLDFEDAGGRELRSEKTGPFPIEQ